MGYSLLKEFIDACYFPKVFMRRLAAPPSLHLETLKEWYRFVYDPLPGELAMRSGDA